MIKLGQMFTLHGHTWTVRAIVEDQIVYRRWCERKREHIYEIQPSWRLSKLRKGCKND